MPLVFYMSGCYDYQALQRFYITSERIASNELLGNSLIASGFNGAGIAYISGHAFQEIQIHA